MDNISTKTIKDFLHQQGYTWKGEISMCGNPATNSPPLDTNNCKPINAVLYNPRQYNQYILINLCQFKFCSPVEDNNSMYSLPNKFSTTLDLSKQWQQFLYERYGEKYQKALICLSDKNINYLVKTLHNNLKALKEQHKSTFNGVYNEINFWKNIKSYAENLNTPNEKSH